MNKLSVINDWRDIKTQDEILNKDLKKRDQHLVEPFSTNIKFNLNGMLAPMGAGTNKINVHTIARAANAYGRFLLEASKNKTNQKILIAHDDRVNSELYSRIASAVLTKLGFKIVFFDGNNPQSTSMLSFAIKNEKFQGGLMISAFYSGKDFNGMRLYDNNGVSLNKLSLEKINLELGKCNLLATGELNFELDYLDKGVEDKYFDAIKMFTNIKDGSLSNLRIALPSLSNTNSASLKTELETKGASTFSYSNKKNINFSTTASLNPEDSKAYDKILSIARKNKSDIAFTMDSSAERVGAIVKYQRRYKYMNGNQMSALYLDYTLSKMKDEGALPKDGFIVKSIVSGELPVKIANKYGIKVIEAGVDFGDISKIIKETKGQFIFAFDGNYGFVLNDNISLERDAVQLMLNFSKMAAYLKSIGKDSFARLKEIYKEFGIHRSVKFSKKIKPKEIKSILRHVSSLKNIGNHKVKEIKNYKKGYLKEEKSNLIKVEMENGSWFVMSQSSDNEGMDFYVQTIGSKEQELIDIVVFEKQVRNYIGDVSEVFEEKKMNVKTLVKYTIFLSIMALIIWFTFTTIYDSAKSANRSATSIATILFKSKARSIFLIWIAATIVALLLSSLQRKRLISYHGQKVKMRHVMVSSVMGAFVSWVTPFTIGGDAIGYWYLRRKGFKRGALISSYMTSTLIWQFTMIVITAILIPMGFIMYKDQFSSGDVNMKAILIIFSTGISWDIFSTFMIGMLTFNKRFQEWIVRTSIKLLEWLPFIHIQDPGLKAAGPQYEFQEMRKGMKLLFANKKLLFEATSYRFISKFLVLGAFVPMALEVMNPGLQYGSYFSQVIVNDFISTANGMSLTPGGAGTGEYISINLRASLWADGSNGLSSKDISVGLDMLTKFVSSWPYLLLSVIVIGVIISGERRKDVHKKRNLVNQIKLSSASDSRSKFYIKIIPLWVSLLTAYLLVFYLI